MLNKERHLGRAGKEPYTALTHKKEINDETNDPKKNQTPHTKTNPGPGAGGSHRPAEPVRDRSGGRKSNHKANPPARNNKAGKIRNLCVGQKPPALLQ